MAQFKLVTRDVTVILEEHEYLIEADSLSEAEKLFRMSQGDAPSIQHLRKTVNTTEPVGPANIPCTITPTSPEEMLFPALLANG